MVSSTPQQSRELQLFYETIMQAAGKQLSSAGVPAPSSNYCQMLQDISEVRRFEIACFDISERSTTGKCFANPVVSFKFLLGCEVGLGELCADRKGFSVFVFIF
jgi:hypothetical protein